MTSSYSYSQNKNKRPLSSFNPKSYSSQSNEPIKQPVAPVKPVTQPVKPVSQNHESSASPDLDESVGVIGGQEIYNDPREKMMRQKESIRR